MINTIVRLFDSATTAQTVVRQLGDKGLARDEIVLIEKDGKDGRDITSDGDELIERLHGLGVPEDAARLYGDGVREGKTLVAARVSDSMIDPVMDIMNNSEAVDVQAVDVNEQTPPYQQHKSNQPARPGGRADTPDAERTAEFTPVRPEQNFDHHLGSQEVALPIVEERLEVGKRVVQRGGIRVNSRVIETPVEETVQLREEHFNVERRTVDRPVSEADLAAFKESTIEFTETAEEVVITKHARVVEEVIVSKVVKEHAETVRDTVRRTDVEVEELGTESAKSDKAKSAGGSGS